MELYVLEVIKSTEVKLDKHTTRIFHEIENRCIWPDKQKLLEWVKSYIRHGPADGFHWIPEWMSLHATYHVLETNKVTNEYGHVVKYDIWIKPEHIPG